MLTTTITVFSRDKAYSDALDILQTALDTTISDAAFDTLCHAQNYLMGQWREYQESRAARMKGKV